MNILSLDPLSYRVGNNYDLETAAPFRVQVAEFAGRTGKLDRLVFGDDTPGAVGEGSWQVWLTLDKDGTLTISEGYAWDLCSPSWQILGKRIGTPSPLSTYKGSVTHDALYQYLDKGPWTRAEADAVFLSLMQHSGFPLAPVYYSAVRVFGGLHHLLFR